MHWSFVWFGYLLTCAAIAHILLRNKPLAWVWAVILFSSGGAISTSSSALTIDPARSKLLSMDAEPNDKTGDSTNQGGQEPTQEAPQSKLRDLRPEKDPMGAGRNRLPKTSTENPS